jgi:hypothetical protein
VGEFKKFDQPTQDVFWTDTDWVELWELWYRVNPVHTMTPEHLPATTTTEHLATTWEKVWANRPMLYDLAKAVLEERQKYWWFQYEIRRANGLT